jgi:hypothetical protein
MGDGIMAEPIPKKPFSDCTKVVVRQCTDCKRDIAILVGFNVPRGEVVSARCPDCLVEFRKKGKLPPEMEEEARILQHLITGQEPMKPGDGE